MMIAVSKTKLWSVCLVLNLIPIFILGQSARFYMEVDNNKISEGETFVITAVLENIKTDAIALPDFTPFQIVSGPNKSSSFSFINGKKSSTISYQYILLATRKGKYTIKPASTNIGSKTIYSNEIIIEVTSGGSVSASVNDIKGDVNLRLEISSKKGYIGQQLLLDYVIYTRENIASYDFLNQPDDDGFYIQPLNDFRQQAQKKVINGKEYYSQVIARQVLFPQKTGDYTIGPISMQVNIPIENNRSLFFRDVKPITIKSNTLKINIAPLPAPQPEDYSGSVGETKLTGSIQKGMVNIGQAIVLNLKIEGNGDPKTTKAPKFNIPDGLEAYEPTLIQDESKQKNSHVQVVKSYEYIFIPKEAKVYTLNPELSYFDPESKTYNKVSAGSFTVNVVESGTQDKNINEETDESNLEVQANYPVYKLEHHRWSNVTFLISIIGISLLTIGGIIYRKKKSEQIIAETNAYNNAETVAQRHLAKAARFKKDHAYGAFYEEIASATTGYVVMKYNIPHSEISAGNIIQLLKDKGVLPTLLSDYEWIHKQAELARFAGTYGNMEKVYDRATRFITGMIS